MDEKGKKLVNARFKLEHAVTTPFTHWEEVPCAGSNQREWPVRGG